MRLGGQQSQRRWDSPREPVAAQRETSGRDARHRLSWFLFVKEGRGGGEGRGGIRDINQGLNIELNY